jgi:hypothetical protein
VFRSAWHASPMRSYLNRTEDQYLIPLIPILVERYEAADLCMLLAHQGLLLAWYYLCVIVSVLSVVLIIFDPSTRPYAAAFLILFWSLAYLPVDYQIYPPFANSVFFKLWRK